VQEIERYNILVQAARDVVGHEIKAQLSAIEDHLAIIDALIARDEASVQRAMGLHIDNAAGIFERAMFPELHTNGHAQAEKTAATANS
jgi:DNA-binding GntR family transcriptional regulator